MVEHPGFVFGLWVRWAESGRVDQPFRGATEAELAALERRVGFQLPADLRKWLALVSGVSTAAGCFLGASLEPIHLSIADAWFQNPEFRCRGWLPIGDDGCGNFYVLDLSDRGAIGAPVYFVDAGTDWRSQTYVMASSIWPFLHGTLRRDSEGEGDFSVRWPFDRTTTLDFDAALNQHAYPVRLAWERARELAEPVPRRERLVARGCGMGLRVSHAERAELREQALARWEHDTGSPSCERSEVVLHRTPLDWSSGWQSPGELRDELMCVATDLVPVLSRGWELFRCDVGDRIPQPEEVRAYASRMVRLRLSFTESLR